MTVYYRCDDCDTIHSSNPKECRNCGNRIFHQYEPSVVERITVGLHPLR